VRRRHVRHASRWTAGAAAVWRARGSVFPVGLRSAAPHQPNQCSSQDATIHWSRLTTNRLLRAKTLFHCDAGGTRARTHTARSRRGCGV
jgi:hypothetical protein